MSFKGTTASDGIIFLLLGIWMCWIAYGPIPAKIFADPIRLKRRKRMRELYAFAGPGIAVISLLFIIAKMMMPS